ncbi:uncharacterized membrane-anchored protein YjiN (DUF445 family) [Pseudoduganella lurida]|uniref:Uncharacterized membrane-anchored protein YjiN (DUF445 family) n=1 Tax=Pseudoduganella lurida TaxID=1036180 RepID=A0A562QZ24_9BURK|nr:DUF445 domain-containing protein [Pseudoduganella lurida]TWI61584.1 uncharacterized membrane-anchored protein YjiN (DUF445 family) [Pseudoduganella lurida]
MPHRDPRQRLRRIRLIATCLLAAMAALFVAARLLQPGYPWLGFVAAFAEAAMVGGLADWFAVTALFRHPLGLPIPHTAIIPRNKDRIGANIAEFLEHNFITPDVVRSELQDIDLAGVAARWLADEANSRAVAERIVGTIPAVLNMVEDRDAAAFVGGALSSSLKDVRLAPVLAQVLTVLVSGRQHVRLLQKVLGLVAHALEENRGYIRQKVHEHSPKWIPRMVDEKFFERLMDGIGSILDDMANEDGAWRQRFQLLVEELIDNLQHSPEYEDKLRALLTRGLEHPLFRAYVAEVWTDLRERLLNAGASPESRLLLRVQDAVRIFANALAQNEPVRIKLNDWLKGFAAEAIVERRGLIVAVVQKVIDKWDAETVSAKLEQQVGSDLQFIRISGTLVGGVVGVLLYSVSLLLGAH